MYDIITDKHRSSNTWLQYDQTFELKVAQYSPKIVQNIAASVFTLKVTFFKMAQKWPNIFPSLCKKFVEQNILDTLL